HEFHYYESDCVGDSFVGKFLNGKETSCGICSGTLYAGFPHIAFYSNEKSAERFVDKCIEMKAKISKEGEK
ncbi:MAG: cobyrinate a,c-diamide synthase, partial [Clostridia bacterium]